MKIPILRIPFDDADKSFIQSRMTEILDSGMLAMGKNVKEFEERFAKFCSSKYAIATNSGTSALEIALRAHNVEGGSVVVPTNTFMASVFAPVHAGAKVIFTDCTREDLCMDYDDLQEKIRKDTKAVVIVHIGGIVSSKVQEIRKLCDEQGIFLLEDAAHAHGAEFNGKVAGSLGHAAAFSFFPTKVMTSCEGGMITTDLDGVDEMSRTYRDEGKQDTRFNRHTVFGNNWRMSEVHAVIGLAQMAKAEWILSERRRVAALYDKKLKCVSGLTALKMKEGVRSAYYKYIAMLDDGISRDAVKSALNDRFGVSLTGEVYADLCHDQPVFDRYPSMRLNSPSDRFPNAEDVSKRHVCLPLYPGLKEEEVDYVVESLKQVL